MKPVTYKVGIIIDKTVDCTPIIRIRVDFPHPLMPITPIFAPCKKPSVMFLKIVLLSSEKRFVT